MPEDAPPERPDNQYHVSNDRSFGNETRHYTHLCSAAQRAAISRRAAYTPVALEYTGGSTTVRLQATTINATAKIENRVNMIFPFLLEVYTTPQASQVIRKENPRPVNFTTLQSYPLVQGHDTTPAPTGQSNHHNLGKVPANQHFETQH